MPLKTGWSILPDLWIYSYYTFNYIDKYKESKFVFSQIISIFVQFPLTHHRPHIWDIYPHRYLYTQLHITFLNSAVTKRNVHNQKETLCLYLFASDFHESRIQLTKHFSTYFCNYGRCCLAILKMKIFFDFLIGE